MNWKHFCKKVSAKEEGEFERSTSKTSGNGIESLAR